MEVKNELVKIPCKDEVILEPKFWPFLNRYRSSILPLAVKPDPLQLLIFPGLSAFSSHSFSIIPQFTNSSFSTVTFYVTLKLQN